ncbi:hypothetical protein [Algiphilus sp.]|uniref:hypothetical protein n=1 Tax=Algiphilus sp. TaxID=1872431 RepID=UPI003C6A94C7
MIPALVLMLVGTAVLASAQRSERRRIGYPALTSAATHARRATGLVALAAALTSATMALGPAFALLFWLLGTGICGMTVAVAHGLRVRRTGGMARLRH